MQRFENSSVILVGDFIKKSIKNEVIIACSDYLQQVNSAEKPVLFVGQGLSEQQLNLVAEQLYSKENPKNISSIKKADLSLTHKLCLENVMISEPNKIDENKYECQLMIDDHCAEMSDHLTGQHIQAMVLIEAARQMNIAVAEKYLISPIKTGKTSFVLHEMQTHFHRYIYPFAVDMQYSIHSSRYMPTGHFKSTVTVTFLQNDKKCLDIDMEYSVMDKKFLEDKESNDILKIVNELFDSNQGV